MLRRRAALARDTGRVRQGDYSVRAQNRSGEVGALADTINALAAALEREEGRRARYLADLGHELRTPITSLRGYTEGLEDGLFEADQSYFALMQDELNHLTALTHSIEAMDLRREEAVIEPGEGMVVCDLVRDAERRWAAQFPRRDLPLHVDVDVALQDRRIAVSAKSLRHIIDNLMSNMVRYADEGVPCQITLAAHAPHAIALTFRNGAASLSQDAVPLLFDRFFRFSNSRTRARNAHSSGLGLAIVKELCLAHGGTARADLKDGMLSILIELPLIRER